MPSTFKDAVHLVRFVLHLWEIW